jgi:hypothetical protein
LADTASGETPEPDVLESVKFCVGVETAGELIFVVTLDNSDCAWFEFVWKPAEAHLGSANRFIDFLIDEGWRVIANGDVVWEDVAMTPVVLVVEVY